MARLAQEEAGAARPPRPGIQTQIETLLFTRLSKLRRPVHCVQIGANDGLRDDPIHAHIERLGWQALLVEPVPHLYERLCDTYRGVAGVRCVHAAITETGETLPFYHLPPRDDQEDWHESLGSFRKEVLLSHRKSIPDIESRLAEIAVPCLSLEALLAQESVTAVDLLVVDAEGYDFEILRAFDFARYKPAMVYFEHKHLEAEKRAALRALLEAQGLKLLGFLHNTIALDERLAPPEDRAFLLDCYRESTRQTLLLAAVSKVLTREGLLRVRIEDGKTLLERVEE